MIKKCQILNKKLIRPQTVGMVPRKRLHPLLSQIPSKSLTIVTAGAGFGKTTLISEACAMLGIDTVWYRMDSSDRDFVTFFCYLISGIKAYYPHCGRKAEDLMEEADVTDRSGQEAILIEFLKEIESTVKRDMIIVLDDYHEVQGVREINDSLKFLLSYLPETIHLIIISRQMPAVNASKFRARQQLLDITEKEILFDLLELTALSQSCFKLSLDNENVEILHRKTNGWVAGLILILSTFAKEGAYKEDGREAFLSKIGGTSREVSDYLGENVFGLQSEERKQFLLKTAVLSHMSPEFCNRFLGIDNASKILAELEEDHLFTFSYDHEKTAYHYHQLFREFLLKKVQDKMGGAVLKELNFSAGKIWEEEEAYEESLRHYLSASKYESLCLVLEKTGKKYIDHGRIQLINSYVSKIPETVLHKYPRTQYLKASLLESSGNLRTAETYFQTAYQGLLKIKDVVGCGRCLFSLGGIYYQIGEFDKAENMLTPLVTQFDKKSPHYLEISGSLVFITSHQGNMEKADAYIADGKTAFSGITEKRALAWFYFNMGFRYCFAGDFRKGLQLGKKTKAICDRMGAPRLMAYNDHLISWSHYYLGQFSEGMKVAEEGLDLVKERGYQLSARAWLLMDYALNAGELGNTKKALQTAKEGLAIFQNQESIWGQVWSYQILYDVHMMSGDCAAAEDAARTGLALTQDIRLPLHEGFLKLKLARCLLDQNKSQGVRTLLLEAKTIFPQSGMLSAMISLSTSRLYWKEGRQDKAVRYLQASFCFFKSGHYDTWVIKEKKWIMPLLFASYGSDQTEHDISMLLRKMGEDVESFNVEAGKNTDGITGSVNNTAPVTPPLHIYCLGKFRIFKGEEEIANSRWKSKKARTLLKYFVCFHGRGFLEKDVLMEFLWPDENPLKTTGRLHDTVSALRKTLEPDIKKGAPSCYILREGSAYRLSLGDMGGIDVNAFRKLLKQASLENRPDRKIDHYLKAEQFYTGDFLEEDIYAEGLKDERDQLRMEYLGLLENIISYFESRYQYDRCIEYANIYLQKDKYAEPVFRKLMQYYHSAGNHSMILKTFEKCKENMLSGYDSPVSRETKMLLTTLWSGK